jgi:hypothetical protein
MWFWRERKTPPPEQPPVPNSAARKRLFLLATALVARGMKPEEAYKTALHYIEGEGRGRTWISALAEADRREEPHAEA